MVKSNDRHVSSAAAAGPDSRNKTSPPTLRGENPSPAKPFSVKSRFHLPRRAHTRSGCNAVTEVDLSDFVVLAAHLRPDYREHRAEKAVLPRFCLLAECSA